MRRVRPVDDLAVTGVDHMVERRGCRRDAIEQPQPAQQFDLIAADLLDPELGRICAIAIDQRHAMPGPTENRGGKRSAQSRPYDRDIHFVGAARRGAGRSMGPLGY